MPDSAANNPHNEHSHHPEPVPPDMAAQWEEAADVASDLDASPPPVDGLEAEQKHAREQLRQPDDGPC